MRDTMGNYFVKIESASELRRSILESSKASLHSLRGYQELLILRSQKKTLVDQLRRELKELTVLINRAEALMPELSEKELNEIMPKPPTIVQKQPMPQSMRTTQDRRRPLPPPSAMSELDKLEQQLASIQGKLGNL